MNLIFFFKKKNHCPSRKWELDFCLTSWLKPKRPFILSAWHTWISLIVKRERYLTSHGLDATKRTCRGRFLQKKWCTEYATIPSLKPSIKWITFPVTWHKAENRAGKIFLFCISLNEWSWIYEGGDAVNPPQTSLRGRCSDFSCDWCFSLSVSVVFCFFSFCKWLEIPVLVNFFWQCWLNMCCIGTGGAGISWLLLPLPQFITGLWPLLQGQTVVPSYSTLWGPDFTVLASEVLPLHQEQTWRVLIPSWSTRMLW